MTRIKDADRRLIQLQKSLLRWQAQFSRLVKQAGRDATTWEYEKLLEISSNAGWHIDELAWELRRLSNIIFPGGIPDEPQK